MSATTRCDFTRFRIYINSKNIQTHHHYLIVFPDHNKKNEKTIDLISSGLQRIQSFHFQINQTTKHKKHSFLINSLCSNKSLPMSYKPSKCLSVFSTCPLSCCSKKKRRKNHNKKTAHVLNCTVCNIKHNKKKTKIKPHQSELF